MNLNLVGTILAIMICGGSVARDGSSLNLNLKLRSEVLKDVRSCKEYTRSEFYWGQTWCRIGSGKHKAKIKVRLFIERPKFKIIKIF